MAFIGTGLIDYGVFPAHFKLVSELSVSVLLTFSFIVRYRSRKPYQIPYLGLWASLFFIALISCLVNGYFNFRSISSLRFIFRYYLLFVALVNLEIEDKLFRKINKFLLVLFILQLPVVAYKFTIWGVSERTIGSYAARGGGLTTMIPVVMVSFFISYYYFFERSKWYIFLALCFILWGVVGAKAALFFIFPINFLGLYYLLWIKNEGFKLRDLKNLGIVGTCAACLMGLFLYAQPRLNPDREAGGKIDFSYALEYAQDYETGTHYMDERIGTGRVATTLLSIKQLINDGSSKVLFGYGSGILTPAPFGKDKNYDSRVYLISNSYGITGMVYIWVEYGIFGVLIFCLIFLSYFKLCWRWHKGEEDKYYKAFSAGATVFCILNLFIFLSYNRLPVADDTLLPVFYYSMALAQHRHFRGKFDHTR